jgi:long-chain acyl-CoA synthetase
VTALDRAFTAMQSREAYLAAPPHITASECDRQLALIDPDHLGVFSSGSTDSPRCILRSWESWRSSFAAIDSRLGVESGEIVGLIGPSHSTMVLFAALHAFHNGAVPELMNADAQPAGARTVDAPGVDVWHGVPAALDRVLDHIITGRCRTPRLMVTAGASAPAALWEKAERAGVAVVEYFGAAETSFIAWRQSPGAFEAIPGCDIDVRDEQIWVRSPYVALGYLEGVSGPMRTDGDWVTVGDIGRLTDDGGLVVRGRGDTAITTAGHTVLIADVEAALRTVPGVGDVVVLGVHHERLGEIIAAAHTGRATSEAMRQAARALPAPSRPRLWAHLTEFPYLPGGKVDRRTLALQMSKRREGP